MVKKSKTAPKGASKSTVKTASKNTAKAAKQQVTNPDTRVVCPVCGSEFDVLAEHEHTVQNATVLGVNSGLGTIELPVSKRGDALKAAGIDPSKYFSIKIPGGGEQWMKKTDDGGAVVVAADDPVISQIISQGTVPNRKLFRRWVMSQVFHGLQADGGITEWIHRHYYNYQWQMLIEELRVQAKLYGKDPENYHDRHRWFNRELVVAMAEDYLKQLCDDAMHRKTHKCKGIPYVSIDHKDYFVTDIDKKLLHPLRQKMWQIRNADTAEALYKATRAFWQSTPCGSNAYKQCPQWVDAYKGMGAYATMQNLIRFHGCQFPKDNLFYQVGKTRLQMLENAAQAYENGQGWRLFGVLKQMIEENGIDILAKQKEWARAKSSRRTA